MSTQKTGITPAAVEALFRLRPELVDEVNKTIDSQIDELNSLKAAIAGETITRKSNKQRKSGGERVKRGLHGEVAIKALSALGATSASNGKLSGDIKQCGISKFEHNFGHAMNATLDALARHGVVAYENVSENNKPRYKFWLQMPKEAALELAATAAKAGRKVQKKSKE